MKVSLVLGGGGARGYAHIGVIKALLESGYTICGISGCSMGALVGGFYGAGKLDELETWARSLTYLDVIKLVDLSFLSSGAIRGDRVFSIFKEMLGDIQIEDLGMPYTAVATDLTNQKEVWFSRGPLEEAIRASCAIPSLLTPVVVNGRLLVDGGVLNPLPMAPSVSVHADCIIAVDVCADVPVPMGLKVTGGSQEPTGTSDKQSRLTQIKQKALFWKDAAADDIDTLPVQKELNSKLGKLSIMYQMFETMQTSLTHYKIAGYRPDLLIKIPKSSARIYEFYHADMLIDLGYRAAQDAIEAYEFGKASVYGQI